MEICKLPRTDPCDYGILDYGGFSYFFHYAPVPADAYLLLLFRSADPVRAGTGNPFFLSVYSSAETKSGEGRSDETSHAHHAETQRDKVVCIIDDNPNKWHRDIDGVPVVGGRDDILSAVQNYKVDKIYLAIPSISAGERRDILNICKETECELKNLPGIYQLR